VNRLPVGTRVTVRWPFSSLDGRTGEIIAHQPRDGRPACDVKFTDGRDGPNSAHIFEDNLQAFDDGQHHTQQIGGPS